MLAASEKHGPTCSPFARLVHIIADHNWCFKRGDQTVTLLNEPTFFKTRAASVEAARRAGYFVDRQGCLKGPPTTGNSIPAWVRKPDDT